MENEGKTLEERGVDAAVRFLQARGYEIVERGWSCDAGEFDVIAVSPEDALCFVEVETRRDRLAGERVGIDEDRKKLSELAQDVVDAAVCYLLQDYDGEERMVRYDVIIIDVLSEGRALLRHHIGGYWTD